MHELSIMQSALQMVIEQAKAHGAKEVHELRLRIGTLSGVVPESLEFCFEAASLGTIAEGATLVMESVPAACWCGQCQKMFVCGEMWNECPECKSPSFDLRQGRELEVVSFEVS